MPQGQADIIETLDQAEFAERIKFKRRLEPLSVGDGLVFKRNRELIARNLLCVFEKRRDLLLRKANEHDAVIAGVREKDVCKGWSDDATESEVAERPCSVLAARSAAEVFSGH